MTVGGALGERAKIVDGENAKMYRGPNNPHPSWYKAFTSACYKITLVDGRLSKYLTVRYRLEPVPGRVVYTFDDCQEIVESTRLFATRLLYGNEGDTRHGPTYIGGVSMYRMRMGPPIEHELYSFEPLWPEL